MKNILDLLNKDEYRLVKMVKVEKNTILFREDEVCENIGVVISGEIQIASVSLKGVELVYNHLKQGEIFGNNLLFSLNPRYRGNVFALKDSVVGLINKNNLLKILAGNHQFLLKYLSLQSDSALQVNLKLKILSIKGAEERFLLYLKLHDNEIMFENITSLAKQLFLSREALSRLISKLVKSNVIIKKGHRIKLI